MKCLCLFSFLFFFFFFLFFNEEIFQNIVRPIVIGVLRVTCISAETQDDLKCLISV